MRVLRAALLLLLLTAILRPQTSSTITGIVTDTSTAVIPGAGITVTCTDTGAVYHARTNSDGYYTLASLPAFNYTVKAELDGMKPSITDPFKLDGASSVRVDITLVPADSKQTVEVHAAAPAINTESGELGTTVSIKEVTDLPIQGRNALSLVALVPGVGGEMSTDETGLGLNPPTPGAGVSIGGGRLSSTGYQTDGAASTSVGTGRATATLSTDSVQEVKVITSNYSAQYGSVGSGIVSLISKSGTNEFHGSAFWAQRNPALTARGFNAAAPPNFRRNEFGVTIGGPVWIPKVYDGHNKTFFFASVEPKRYFSSSESRTWVPTAEERQGDFRNSWVGPGSTRPLLYQQFNCFPSPSNCQQFTYINRATSSNIYPLFSADDPDPTKRGHVIPKEFLSPAIQKYLQLVPMPNMPYDASGFNYLGVQGNDGKDNRWNIKGDQVVTQNNRLSARYTNIPITGLNFQIAQGVNPRARPSHVSTTRQPYLSDTHIFSPRVVNNLRLAYSYGDYSVVPPYDVGTRNYTQEYFGLPSGTGWGIPQLAIVAGGGTFVGATWGMQNPNSMGITTEHQYQIADDITMTFGRHTMMVGTDLREQMLNIKGGTALGAVCCGLYNIPVNATDAGNSNAPGGLGGNSFASFLIGVPGSEVVQAAMIPYYYRWKVVAGYVQDDFKVRRNVTLNLGVRYEYNSPRSEKYNRQASIDLANPVPLKDAKGNTNGYTVNYLYSGFDGRSIYLEPTHKLGFEPRFGFAWTPDLNWNRDRRLVVRGGYAISHLPMTGRARTAAPDFGASPSGGFPYQMWTGTGSSSVTQSQNPQYPIRIGSNAPVPIFNPLLVQIPSNGVLCAGCTPLDPRVPGTALVAYAPTNQLSYIQTWNLTIQRELPAQITLTLSYLGSKGTHLYSPPINYNQPTQTAIDDLLNRGIDPTSSIPDPFGRVDANGKPINVTYRDLSRPYPTVSDILMTGITTANSIYHAGSIEMDRRFQRGLGLRANYTWSKSIDSSSDSSGDSTSVGSFGVTQWQNPLDPRSERSVSMFDIRHRLNIVGTWELPFGKGKPILRHSGRLLDSLVGGWQLNAIETTTSGLPAEIGLGDTNGISGRIANVGMIQVIRPDIIPGVPIINPLWNRNTANTVPYWNPAAFSRPAYGMMGNAARTLDFARGPFRSNLDASLMKNIYPFEDKRRYLQLRGEFYNVMNHATFRPPNASNIFSGTPPVSLKGTSLAGPIPYYPGVKPGQYSSTSREGILASYYNPSFGIISPGGSGRTISFMVRLQW